MPRLRMLLLLLMVFGPGSGLAEEAAGASGSDLFVRERTGSGLVCRPGGAEHAALAAAVPASAVRPIESSLSDKNLRAPVTSAIVLRTTEQLASYPEARAAFERAAARWEQIIQSPITVVIDVDFGPTRFGTPFPNADTIGATNTDLRTALYTDVRAALVASLPGSLVYNALPLGSVPTDIGQVTQVVAPSAAFRVLGILPAVAPDDSQVPSIGFNSSFDFDFDPSDGIEPGRTDFDAVAMHEFGHVLGFNSRVGQQEVAPGSPTSISIWDLFRFRPGVTLSTFPTQQRILIPGGEQIFFEGTGTLPLSTAAPNGVGGDGRTASHWKDDALSLFYIGIMDPTLVPDERFAVSYFDLIALFWIGYSIGPSTVPPTVVSLEPAQAIATTDSLSLSVFGFDFAQGAVVLWRGSQRPTQFISSGEVRAQLAPGDLRDPGIVAVEVINPDSIPSETLYFTIQSNPGGPCERGESCDPRRPRLVAPRG